MDERSFDNLVRDLAGSRQSRRTLALAAAGLVLSIAALPVADTEAARRRRGGRRKSAGSKKGSSGKGGGGKKPQDGHQGDCDSLETCPRDPATGQPGFPCPDGQCSCGGLCCEKGYACFVGKNPDEEVCCFDDAAATEIPKDVDFAVCPGATDRDTCCKSSECDKGECQSFTPGRYRRNPR